MVPSWTYNRGPIEFVRKKREGKKGLETLSLRNLLIEMNEYDSEELIGPRFAFTNRRIVSVLAF